MTRIIRNLLHGGRTVVFILPPEVEPSFHHQPSVGRCDSDAIRGDAEKIGGDFKAAMKRISNGSAQPI